VWLVKIWVGFQWEVSLRIGVQTPPQSICCFVFAISFILFLCVLILNNQDCRLVTYKMKMIAMFFAFPSIWSSYNLSFGTMFCQHTYHMLLNFECLSYQGARICLIKIPWPFTLHLFKLPWIIAYGLYVACQDTLVFWGKKTLIGATKNTINNKLQNISFKNSSLWNFVVGKRTPKRMIILNGK
jgi:hypothetical protein